MNQEIYMIHKNPGLGGWDSSLVQLHPATYPRHDLSGTGILTDQSRGG